MYLKLSYQDIDNCLEALTDTEELTESERKTISKLKAIRYLQTLKLSTKCEATEVR